MKTLIVKTPAKVNLTLEITGKRFDGFHNIQSIMQAVSIFDLLTFEVSDIPDKSLVNNEIKISGNSNLIPYDSSNLVYKAAEKFFEMTGIKKQKISIYIEKNIPVAAGLAGGSSNAAGTLLGLNSLFNEPLSDEKINKIAAGLGSDLNFCFEGGTQVASSRGEILQKINTPSLHFIIAKPKNLFISAKEAYTKYSQMTEKPDIKKTQAMIDLIKSNTKDVSARIAELLNNNLETAIIDDYSQIKELKTTLIKAGCLNAMMSGSGPTVFGICGKNVKPDLNDDFDLFQAESINYGVQISFNSN